MRSVDQNRFSNPFFTSRSNNSRNCASRPSVLQSASCMQWLSRNRFDASICARAGGAGDAIGVYGAAEQFDGRGAVWHSAGRDLRRRAATPLQVAQLRSHYRSHAAHRSETAAAAWAEAMPQKIKISHPLPPIAPPPEQGLRKLAVPAFSRIVGFEVSRCR